MIFKDFRYCSFRGRGGACHELCSFWGVLGGRCGILVKIQALGSLA